MEDSNKKTDWSWLKYVDKNSVSNINLLIF